MPEGFRFVHWNVLLVSRALTADKAIERGTAVDAGLFVLLREGCEVLPECGARSQFLG